MENFEVRIFFSGMIALVKLDDEVRALVINIPEGHTVGNLQLPKHYPLLVLMKGTCVEGDCDAGDLWELELEDLSFTWEGTSDAARQKLTFLAGRSNRIFPNNATEAADFSWVVKISDLISRPARIKPVLLKPSPIEAGSPSLVAARVAVTEGELSTSVIAKHDENPAEFRFQPLASGGDAGDVGEGVAMAEMVAARMTSPATAKGFCVTARSFDRSGSRSMVIRPDEDLGFIELLVLNGPQNPNSSMSTPENLIGHFGAYYDLLESPIRPMDRVLPHATIISPGIQGARDVQPALGPSLDDWRASYFPENPKACPPSIVDPPESV